MNQDAIAQREKLAEEMKTLDLRAIKLKELLAKAGAKFHQTGRRSESHGAWMSELKLIAIKRQELQMQMGKVKRDSWQSFGITFMDAARELLSPDDFLAIRLLAEEKANKGKTDARS
jgi:hypothetical protein